MPGQWIWRDKTEENQQAEYCGGPRPPIGLWIVMITVVMTTPIAIR